MEELIRESCMLREELLRMVARLDLFTTGLQLKIDQLRGRIDGDDGQGTQDPDRAPDRPDE